MSLDEEEIVAEEDVVEDEAVEDEATQQGVAGTYNATEVNDQVFEELLLGPEIVAEVQGSWGTLLRNAASREAAGEAIYAALFDAAPSLQSLFKTPRAVMAMRFMTGLNNIIGSLNDPKALKVVVETLGFQHLDLEVTPPRVVIFRDAIVDLLSVELGPQFSKKAKDGWATFLNYVGGAYIYIRVKFTDRLKILASSWATANKKDESEEEKPAVENNAAHASEGSGSGKTGQKGFQNTAVPTTFNDMFLFNAAVMGFRGSLVWMNEVLASFDTIVTNVSSSYRLQEECDVLSLRIAKYKGTINLQEYKAVMLASLRSLVPKGWDSNHEVAWSWLWENVERMLKGHMGKPAAHQRALEAFLGSLDENALNTVRREVYVRFFALAPAGQDFFKQSTTRLYFIADLVVAMTLDMFKDPKRMVEDISALGLRHVGYGIPTDLFGAFVTGCVEVVRSLTDNNVAEEAFRWSLSLVSRILTRVITEGSTIVMKAINANSAVMLKKAVGCAPRGKRSMWMLNVQVGTQSISPLFWAIETGSLEAARAMLIDLLTIRADRDRYYYGMDDLFHRHPDTIKKLCSDAREMLPILYDKLIWRSRTTENGMRRVNYYVKHLIVDEQGALSPATEWVTENRDPQIVCHPVVSLVTDLLWTKVAARSFLLGKCWFLFTICIFVCSQSILNHLRSSHDGAEDEGHAAASSGSAHHRLLSGGSSSEFAAWGGRHLSATTAKVTTLAPHSSGAASSAVTTLAPHSSGAASSAVTTLAPHSSGAASQGTGESGENHGESETVEEDSQNLFGIRIAIFVCRCFIYFCSMGLFIYQHVRNIYRDIKNKDLLKISCVSVPAYLSNWQEVVGLALTLMLILMLCCEPILYCLGKTEELFAEHCEAGERNIMAYSIFSALAAVLYCLLIIDLTVFSTRISAFVLVCSRLLSEVGLFLIGLSFFVLTFACAVSTLEHSSEDFAGIPISALTWLKTTLSMVGGSHFDILAEEPVVLVITFVHIISTVIFLINLLIAQLSCAYSATYQDMLGFARLNRGKIVVDTMVSVPKSRWERFVQSLRLDERVEFGEGDLGLAGGFQVMEPANANVTTVDSIRRYGGSTSIHAQWPEDPAEANSEEDKLDRIEKIIDKAMKRLAKTGKGTKGGSSRGQSASDSGLDVSGSGAGSEAGE